jgi:diguanylate cyclase (GGDEF)-like protein
MGIKIFSSFVIIYTILASLGFFNRGLTPPFSYVLLAVVIIYYLLYTYKREISFVETAIGGIIANLSIQLTGGLHSPLFPAYLFILPVVGYKDIPNNFWVFAGGIFIIEIISGLFNNRLSAIPLIILAATGIGVGLVTRRQKFREKELEKILTKYDSREGFIAPTELEKKTLITQEADIDRHKGIERPLLYFVKFIHETLNAQTTAVFSYLNERISLYHGFSHSELFRPDRAVDLASSIYHQIIAERKSVLIRDFAQNPEELGFYQGSCRIASVMIAPLVLLDRVEGLLVADRQTDRFEDNDKKIFDGAAKTLTYVLAMVRLYEKERYDAMYLNAIADVAKELQRELDLSMILADAIKSFKSLMNFDDISVAKIDEVNNLGIVVKSTYLDEDTRFTLDDGLVGMVARHKNPIIKDDMNEGNLVVLKKGERRRHTSFVGVPIKQDDELLGVIWLEDHQKEKFNREDIKNLNILATQLSLAWQRAKLYYRVKELSIRDGLTGLYNHRHFQETLEQEMRKTKELVLMMIDIDHFKQINDNHGHLAGDEILKYLARLIDQAGIAARYGGEEFAIILPRSSVKRAAEVAVRIKDHLKKHEIIFKETRIRITISIGIAHFPADARTRVELIEKADQALYLAKQQGRDCIVLAQAMGKDIGTEG